jgi:dTDP-4-dehydrorhamnose reductase
VVKTVEIEGAGGVNHLFCFGFGYSARAFTCSLARKDWRVTGTATSAEGASEIAALGHEALVFDGTGPGTGVREALSQATHILVSIPPGPTGDVVLALHGSDIAAARDVAWIGYLSTVGVYGDHQGAWVDETAPARPLSNRSRLRAEAEQAWLEFGSRSGQRVQIFRLAGIYGPGRSALESLRAGTARSIIKPGQVFNRIHVEDIAVVLAAAIAGRGAHSIYNVADDEPAPPQDVMDFAARLLGLPPPPAIPVELAELSPLAASFYAENKRVCNARIKHDLGITLRFPTYREGLRQLAGR